MHVNGNLQKLVKSVNDAFPEVEPIAPWYESLSGEKKEKIYHWERSLAFAEVLAGNGVDDVNKDLAQTFCALGRFYRVRFKSETDVAKVKFDKATRSTWTVEQRSVYSLLERALMYGQKAVDLNRESFSAWTELGISRQADGSHDLAMEALTQSRLLRADQQKARFFLSISQHLQERFSEAERTLTQALGLTVWETQENPERQPDLFYSRACARSRLAFSARTTDGKAFADAAMLDLEKGCPKIDAYRLKLFNDDCDEDGDLEHLLKNYRERIKTIQMRLNGELPSNDVTRQDES